MQPSSFLGLFAAPILATKLLLPLYRYPEDGSWDSIYSTIEGNPDLEFQIIINVDSGPGSSSPNSDFATGTAKLNSYSNVETLGYVHTLYGEASQDDVNKNVSDWFSWNSYSGANTAINGIFFDEVHNTEGDESDVTYMQALTQSAISTFGSHKFINIFNPGSKPEHLEFYQLADYVVVFETVASEYSTSVLSENVPAGYANQSAILIPDFASVGSASQAQSWLQGMVDAGIASAHILNFDYLESTSTEDPAAIGSIAKVLASMQGSSSSSTSSTTTSHASITTAKATTVKPTTAATTVPDADGEDSDGETSDDVPVTTSSASIVQATTLATVTSTAAASYPTDDESSDDEGADDGSGDGDDDSDGSGDGSDDSGDDSDDRPKHPHHHHNAGRCSQHK